MTLADEQGQAVIKVSISATKRAIDVLASVPQLTAQALADVTRVSRTGLGYAASKSMRAGEMTLRAPKGSARPASRAAEITPQMLRSLKADMRRIDVDFLTSTGTNGQTNLKFTGRDAGSLNRALQRLASRLNKHLGHRIPGRSALKNNFKEGGTRTRPNASSRISKHDALARIASRQKQLSATARAQQLTPKHTRSHGAR